MLLVDVVSLRLRVVVRMQEVIQGNYQFRRLETLFSLDRKVLIPAWTKQPAYSVVPKRLGRVHFLSRQVCLFSHVVPILRGGQQCGAGVQATVLPQGEEEREENTGDGAGGVPVLRGVGTDGVGIPQRVSWCATFLETAGKPSLQSVVMQI